jgi:hypothetical protein
MLDLIKEIIKATGPRRAGTDAEAKAQHLLLDKCAPYTDKTEFLLPENIEPQALEKIKDVLLHFVKSWDLGQTH